MRRCRPGRWRNESAIIKHQLTTWPGAAGASSSARRRQCVYKLSVGVPRVINLLCDRALILGHLASAGVVEQDAIDEAAEELGLTYAHSTLARAARAALAAFALTLLMLVGAIAAAWVFRAPLSRAIVQWEAAPQPPAMPALQSPAPLIPPAPPAAGDARQSR
jgi:general secretion pathway protein A